MDSHIKQVLEQARRDERFEHVDCVYMQLLVFYDKKDKEVKMKQYSTESMGKEALTAWLEKKADLDERGPLAPELANLEFLGGLRLLVQSSIHKPHGFGKREKISFDNAEVFRKIVEVLKLPQTYILALNHAKGVAECCPTDPSLANEKLDFIAQDIMYHDDAWSLAISHNLETRITTGFLRADGRTDVEALERYLRNPKRAFDVDGMLEYSKTLKRKFDVDIVLKYLKLKSSKPCTSTAAVVKNLQDSGQQCSMSTVDKYLKYWGFKGVLVKSSSGSTDSGSGSEIDAGAVARFLSRHKLQYDLDVISKDLGRFREKVDVEAIRQQLIDAKEKILHPMLLPTIMFHGLKVSSESHLNVLHGHVHDIEELLGRVKTRNDPAAPNKGPVEDQEKLDDELDYQLLSRKLNDCNKDQASRDGRHHFRRQFQTNLQRAVKVVEQYARTSDNTTDILKKTGDEIEQWISFNTRIFEFEEGRDVNYRARIEAQLSLLYSLISQIQRRAQERIAKSTGEDSGDMKYIAYLGSIFLPANLVAAIFAVKEWQMKDPWEIVKFSVASIVIVGLVIVVLNYKQLKTFFEKLLGFKPAPGETSTRKSGSLDWGNTDRPRTKSVSSDDQP